MAHGVVVAVVIVIAVLSEQTVYVDVVVYWFVR